MPTDDEPIEPTDDEPSEPTEPAEPPSDEPSEPAEPTEPEASSVELDHQAPEEPSAAAAPEPSAAPEPPPATAPEEEPAPSRAPSEPLPLRSDPVRQAEAALEQAAAARGEPAEVHLPREPVDPFDAARSVLEKAAAARGALPDPDPFRRDTRTPLERAEDALAAAADARAHARSEGQAGRAREDAAREQLAQLKSMRGAPPSPGPSDDTPTPPSSPKKRSL